jgi:hypothetical protein
LYGIILVAGTGCDGLNPKTLNPILEADGVQLDILVSDTYLYKDVIYNISPTNYVSRVQLYYSTHLYLTRCLQVQDAIPILEADGVQLDIFVSDMCLQEISSLVAIFEAVLKANLLKPNATVVGTKGLVNCELYPVRWELYPVWWELCPVWWELYPVRWELYPVWWELYPVRWELYPVWWELYPVR